MEIKVAYHSPGGFGNDRFKVTRNQIRQKGIDFDRGRYGFWRYQEVFCLHCGQSFSWNLRMWDRRDGLLVCPFDGCDGTPMDWSAEPWK